MDDFTKEYGLEGRFVVAPSAASPNSRTMKRLSAPSVGCARSSRHPRPDRRRCKGGQGKNLESLRKLVTSLGLENHVVFTGSQSDMAEIYALSRVVVSSSRKPESFGRPPQRLSP